MAQTRGRGRAKKQATGKSKKRALQREAAEVARRGRPAGGAGQVRAGDRRARTTSLTWLQRVSLVCLVIFSVATAGDLVAGHLPPQSQGLGMSMEKVYFEQDGTELWNGWTTFAAEVEAFPLPGTGPFGLWPNIEGLRLHVAVGARAEVPFTAAGLEPTVGSLIVHLPQSAVAERLATRDEQAFLVDNLLQAYGISGATVPLVYVDDDAEVDPFVLTDDSVTLNPALVLPTYVEDKAQGRGTTTVFAFYSMYMDVPEALIQRDGLGSGRAAFLWDSALSQHGAGLGPDAEQDGLLVTACRCGLESVSPEPTGRYTNTILWDEQTYDAIVPYEVSIETWVGTTITWFRNLLIPSLAGWALPLVLRRRRPDLAT